MLGAQTPTQAQERTSRSFCSTADYSHSPGPLGSNKNTNSLNKAVGGSSTAPRRWAEERDQRGASPRLSYFDVHGIVLQRYQERGGVLRPPQRLLVRGGRSVCGTLAARQRTSQAPAIVRRDTLLHAIIA